jgi:hypothetical protein
VELPSRVGLIVPSSQLEELWTTQGFREQLWPLECCVKCEGPSVAEAAGAGPSSAMPSLPEHVVGCEGGNSVLPSVGDPPMSVSQGAS